MHTGSDVEQGFPADIQALVVGLILFQKSVKRIGIGVVGNGAQLDIHPMVPDLFYILGLMGDEDGTGCLIQFAKEFVKGAVMLLQAGIAFAQADKLKGSVVDDEMGTGIVKAGKTQFGKFLLKFFLTKETVMIAIDIIDGGLNAL